MLGSGVSASSSFGNSVDVRGASGVVFQLLLCLSWLLPVEVAAERGRSPGHLHRVG